MVDVRAERLSLYVAASGVCNSNFFVDLLIGVSLTWFGFFYVRLSVSFRIFSRKPFLIEFIIVEPLVCIGMGCRSIAWLPWFSTLSERTSIFIIWSWFWPALLLGVICLGPPSWVATLMFGERF